MDDLLKQFKIELIRNDLKVDDVVGHLGLSKPTLYKRIKNPELFTIDNVNKLKQLKLNLWKQSVSKEKITLL